MAVFWTCVVEEWMRWCSVECSQTQGWLWCGGWASHGQKPKAGRGGALLLLLGARCWVLGGCGLIWDEMEMGIRDGGWRDWP